jgi:hypothetical protein
MKSRQIFAGAAYGPATLRVIYKAFDDAWALIESHFDETPTSSETARLRLAHAILAVATEDSKDPEELKSLGLKAIAVQYGLDWTSPSAGRA